MHGYVVVALKQETLKFEKFGELVQAHLNYYASQGLILVTAQYRDRGFFGVMIGERPEPEVKGEATQEGSGDQQAGEVAAAAGEDGPVPGVLDDPVPSGEVSEALPDGDPAPAGGEEGRSPDGGA